MEEFPNTILVVDDTETNIDLIVEFLGDRYDIMVALDGPSALELVEEYPPDMILLDVMMPGMDGFEVCDILKQNIKTRNIPVVMVTALNDVKDRVKALEVGADDFLNKPVDPSELIARVKSSLEVKALRDKEMAYLRMIEEEKAKSDALLHNVLPFSIAERLKHGERLIADDHSEATILFLDIVGFTSLSSKTVASDLVQFLSGIFDKIDGLTEKHGLEKIKTIGDAYMIAAGLPEYREDQTQIAANFSLEVLEAVKNHKDNLADSLQIRIGIHTGPVTAGVIGKKRFHYDLWGDAVNTASRMESHGDPGKIHVTEAVYRKLKDSFVFEDRGMITVKGKGQMHTYFLINTL